MGPAHFVFRRCLGCPFHRMRVALFPFIIVRAPSHRLREEELAMPWDSVVPLVVTALAVLAMIVLARRGVGT